jgi:hypothetical protein
MDENEKKLLRSAINAVIYAAVRETIPAYSAGEQEVLAAALQLNSRTGTVCDHCKAEISHQQFIGEVLAEGIQRWLDGQRKEMNLLVRQAVKGQVLALEVPAKCSAYRQLTMDVRWEDCTTNGRQIIYPPEFYMNSTLVLEDKISLQAGIMTATFATGVRGLVEGLMHRERSLFKETSPDSLRVLATRKPLDSRTIDTYNMGRPARGWFFESILGAVEFLPT